jgi:hypothetical protein
MEVLKDLLRICTVSSDDCGAAFSFVSVSVGAHRMRPIAVSIEPQQMPDKIINYVNFNLRHTHQTTSLKHTRSHIRA